MGVSEDNPDHGDDKSNSESDSWESVPDSGPQSVTGDDCPTCSDTEDTAVKTSHKRFCIEVQASCSPAKQGLWKDSQLEQIGNNCSTVWGSDYEAIKTEWDLTLDRDPSSFKVSGIRVNTD